MAAELSPRFVWLIVFRLFAVKKTKAEIAAQRVWHADREKLRKQRREEQDRNVQRKKALAGKTKTDAVGAAGEEGADDDDGDDGSSEAPSEEGEGEASWDEEEEISEGEVSEDEEVVNEYHSSEDDDDDDKPPRKKRQK